MNKYYEVAIRGMDAFKNLPPSVAEFLKRYFELFNQPSGSKESNRYFADAELVGISTLEFRFNTLREFKIIQTEIKKYYEGTGAGNQSGFVTIRTNRLDPVFKAKLTARVEKLKEMVAERRKCAKNQSSS